MLVHAAGESSTGNLDAGTYAIVKAVPDEKALATVAAELRRKNVEFVSIYEPDPPYNGALMALGLVPKRKEELRRYLRKLPLLK